MLVAGSERRRPGQVDGLTEQQGVSTSQPAVLHLSSLGRQGLAANGSLVTGHMAHWHWGLQGVTGESRLAALTPNCHHIHGGHLSFYHEKIPTIRWVLETPEAS